MAQRVGDGRWLAPSVLRVQAFLELPFTMFAYLAVARLLGRRLHASLRRLPVLFVVGVSFSVTFSIIELALPNPSTRDDLALRYSVRAGEELREAVVQSGRAMADRSTASATSLVRVHPARASSRLT